MAGRLKIANLLVKIIKTMYDIGQCGGSKPPPYKVKVRFSVFLCVFLWVKRYDRSKKNTKDHTDADYFVKTVQIDGKVFDLVADVEKKYGGDGGFVYTLALRDNKKIKASPTHGTPITEPVKSVGNASTDIVSQDEAEVKTQLSLSSKDSHIGNTVIQPRLCKARCHFRKKMTEGLYASFSRTAVWIL